MAIKPASRVIVGKKWDKDAEYVGRPSPLGNPFYMKDESQRDAVCDAYAKWLYEEVHVKRNPVLHAELSRLRRLMHERGTLILGCYCSPKRCHADTIKAYLESY